jgi:hypothetical protein
MADTRLKMAKGVLEGRSSKFFDCVGYRDGFGREGTRAPSVGS